MVESQNTLDNYFQILREFLASLTGLDITDGWISTLLFIGVLLISIAAYYLTIGFLRLVAIIVEKTETDWDDDLINAPLLRGISLLSPAVVAEWLLPHCFVRLGGFYSVIHLIASFYIVAVAVYALNTFLDNLLFAFSRRTRFKPFAVKGIFQMVKLIIISIGIIICISLLIGKSPIAIITALGASAAILMLIFKDTIMGLVASVQLTANKMLHKGDWIVVSKHNANGEVIDISLTTVKVRNWDNSITTIPPYSLVSESFQNFQAMRRSGARRVCRPVYIDINSVGFLTDDKIKQLVGDGFIPADSDSKINLRLFREYMEGWLENNSHVRKDMIYMVRQLEPTSSGLPLEFYFFLNEVKWKEFEHLQSSVFDHIYATAPLFGLSIFQTPAGSDIRDSAVLKTLAHDDAGK